MMTAARRLPCISAIVATYNRADYLRLSLASLLRQDYPGPYEVVVADDGSTDHTGQVISEARAAGRVPVLHYRQEHQGYRRARVLNGGSRLARGEVLVFLDSDCLPALDLLSQYAAHAAPGTFCLGGVYALSRQFSLSVLRLSECPDPAQVLALAARPGNQRAGASARVRRRYWKSRLYAALRFGRPKIWGGNFAIDRELFERVNGFDQNYVGYGQEDSDLRNRLLKGGYRPVCLHTLARSYHLWHEPDIEARRQAMGSGNNRPYYERRNVEVVCRNGLRQLQQAVPRGSLRPGVPKGHR